MIAKKKSIEWVGLGLLCGSLILSVIFYIVVMVNGFGIPKNQHFNNEYDMSDWLSSHNDIGLWSSHVGQTGPDSDQWKVFSSLSNNAVTCITFVIISLGLLISGFVVCNKNKVVITKFLKLTVIFAFVVVAIVLILALIAKPSADLTNVLNGSKTDANLSLWFKFHVGISYDESFDRWSGNINFNYTTQAIPVVILLSLASVPMATYVGLSSFNIAK